MDEIDFEHLEPLEPLRDAVGGGDFGGDEEPVVTYDEARGAREYVLLHPPTVNGVRLERLTVRLPEQADIDDRFSGVLDGNRAMICRLTSLHPAVFKRLKWVDAEALHMIFRDICPSFVTGGEE